MHGCGRRLRFALHLSIIDCALQGLLSQHTVDELMYTFTHPKCDVNMLRVTDSSCDWTIGWVYSAVGFTARLSLQVNRFVLRVCWHNVNAGTQPNRTNKWFVVYHFNAKYVQKQHQRLASET